MAEQTYLLYSFLCAAHGNWRNTLSIRCQECPHGRRPLCPGFLMAMDAEGHPILMPVELLQQMSGESIDVDECVASLRHSEFVALFARWIEWTVASPGDCALLQLVTQRSCHK